MYLAESASSTSSQLRAEGARLVGPTFLFVNAKKALQAGNTHPLATATPGLNEDVDEDQKNDHSDGDSRPEERVGARLRSAPENDRPGPGNKNVHKKDDGGRCNGGHADVRVRRELLLAHLARRAAAGAPPGRAGVRAADLGWSRARSTT